MNGFLLSADTWKYRCVQAYLHTELLNAEQEAKANNGGTCVSDNDKAMKYLVDIRNIIENNNNTFAKLQRFSQVNPLVKTYYNSIATIVDSFFDKDEPWIPSLLTAELLRILSENGYSDFAHIDFLTFISFYEKFENRKSNKIGTHMKCAFKIYETLFNSKKTKKK